MQRLWIWVWALCAVGIVCSNTRQAEAMPSRMHLQVDLSLQTNLLKHRDLADLRQDRVSQIQSEPLDAGTNDMPSEWPLILLQGFSGAIVATVGSIVFQSVIDVIIQGGNRNITEKQRTESGNISALIVFVAVPWVIALTVWGLGKLSNNYHGNYWWTLLGAYAGQLVALGLGFLFNAIDTTADKSVSRGIRFVLDGVLSGAGATIMYNLFRKPHKGIQQIGSLLQLRDGRWTWGLPLPQLAFVEQDTRWNIPMMSGQF